MKLLCISFYIKEMHRKPSFLGGREHLVMNRSGQCLFFHVRGLKQKETTKAGHVVFCIATI